MDDKIKTIFATLDEPVTLASSSAAMLTTKEAGRVVGFGCNGAESGVVIAPDADDISADAGEA
jgi:hypothetical protein